MAKILLVEDDNNLREIYEARLMAEGYDIVSARDGEEALTVAMKEKPDLIISDVMMPKISGFDMLDILRTTEETKNAKVIMMTALSQAEDKARAEKLGADRYLVKSQVTLEDVAKVAKQVLEGVPNPDKIQTTPPVALPPAEPIPVPMPLPVQDPATTPAPVAPPAPALEPSALPPVVTQAPVVEEPPATLPAPEPPTPAAAPAEPMTTNSPMSGDPGDSRKKIIQPINDLNEDTEQKLKELLEREKEREQMAQTVHETIQKVQPPVSTEAGVDAATPEAPIAPPAAPAQNENTTPAVDPNSIAL